MKPTTPTASRTPTRTNTPAVTATASPSPTPTATASATPTSTFTPAATPTTPPPSFTSATFLYDGDGRRVAQTVNGVTTYFIGAHYEVTGSQVTKYYFAGTTRIAMRKYTIPQSMSVEYFISDHLGSTSITTDNAGAKVSEMRYKPWGEVRYSWTAGQSTRPAYELADYTFTGQYSYTAGFGLMFYNARWYDPYLNHFTQPDSIVPDPYNSQDWNRYSYARNNPIRYNDPSGHMVDDGDYGGCAKKDCIELARQNYLFSLAFKGSGENGAWTASDWHTYNQNRDGYWTNPNSWIHPDAPGVDGFAQQTERLASHYTLNDKDQFVRDFALLFGGVSSYDHWIQASLDSLHGPEINPILNESNEGLRYDYVDSLISEDNQSHHYAGIFFFSYFTAPGLAFAGNMVRDIDDPRGINYGDINLGTQASMDAYYFRYYSDDLSDISKYILRLKDPSFP